MYNKIFLEPESLDRVKEGDTLIINPSLKQENKSGTVEVINSELTK